MDCPDTPWGMKVMLSILHSFWLFETEAQSKRSGNNAAMVDVERVSQVFCPVIDSKSIETRNALQLAVRVLSGY